MFLQGWGNVTSAWLQAILCRLLDEISQHNQLVAYSVAPFVALTVDQIKEAPRYVLATGLRHPFKAPSFRSSRFSSETSHDRAFADDVTPAERS